MPTQTIAKPRPFAIRPHSATRPRTGGKPRTTLSAHPSSELRTVTVSSVGQITIPRAIREQLGITPGTELELSTSPDTGTITFRRQKTFDEVMDELDAIDEKYPTPPPDPKYRNMSVGEITLEMLKQPKKGDPDTWV